MIESTLIHKIFRDMDCHSEDAVHNAYWFFRRKTMFLFCSTYIPLPVVGVPLQLFQTFALGQFALLCARNPDLLSDDKWLKKSWKDAEAYIFSGPRAIEFYEQFSGKRFPDSVRQPFVGAVDRISSGYRMVQKIPGAEFAQDVLGLGFEKTLTAAKSVLTRGLKATSKLFN